MSRRPVRALTLAVSVAWAELRHDPLRAALLAVRLLPAPVRRTLRPLEIRLKARPSRTSDESSPARVPAPAGRAILPVRGRVLHLVIRGVPHEQGGPALRTQALTRAQSAAGLDPHVVTRIGFPVTQGVFDARPLHLLEGVPQHRLLPRWLPYGSGPVLARNTELAARLVERVRPSVLHASGDHGDGRVALALRETYGLPVVYEVRGFREESWLAQTHGRSRGDAAYRARREWETYCMRESDAVLTPGEAMKEEIVSRGVPEERVRVVPHAVDPLFLEPLPDGAPLRTRLGIGPEEYVVGTVGGLTRHAGIGTLLEAGAELRRRGVPLRLLLVGDGPERRALQDLAGRLGLGDGTVLFTGRVPLEQVQDHHAVLDVFAVPRTDERVCHLVTPLEPVEAMAGGLPVVAGDVPAMRELVESGVNGRLIPSKSPLAWAEALEMLLESPRTRHAWGAAGRALVTREHTWERVAATTRDTYRALGCL
ncbi:glycosyltransferase family 4 protein [Streptomyces sp. NPDC005731]|uniref:glycosyltransferase family 4 protein n=1 Tax=Streptomyces sp. NPDC005731 TaxID=3157056 RepID=UPI00340339DB